jgi:hypothetical protein
MKMVTTRFGINDTLLSPARQQSTRDMTNSFTDITHNKPSSPPAFLWTDPGSGPAANNVAPPPAAVQKLQGYDHIINIWLAGNSFDYLFGAYPGANGVNTAIANWKPQRQGFGGPIYSCLNTTDVFEYYATLPSSVPQCWPNTGPFPVDVAVPLYAADGTPITWRHDPSHNFYSDIYAIDGGLNDQYVYQGGISAYNVAFYNSSLQGSYLWQLAQNYTLFDNFYKSTFGDSDINFLVGVAAGQPIYWGDSLTACQQVGGPYYTLTSFDPTTGLLDPNSDGIVFNATDCHVIGEMDPSLASYSFPVNVSMAPNTPFVSSRHIGQLLDAAGVSWSQFLMDFNRQYYGNNTNLQPGEPSKGADGSTYSGHNNPFG